MLRVKRGSGFIIKCRFSGMRLKSWAPEQAGIEYPPGGNESGQYQDNQRYPFKILCDKRFFPFWFHGAGL